MILTSLLAAVEAAINPLLRFDTYTLTRLAALEGKVIRVEISDWRVIYDVLPHANGVQLCDAASNSGYDCRIKGKLFDLMQIFSQRGASATLFKYPIDIDGNIELAEQLRGIMQRVEIDWEALVANVLGDTVGYPVTQQMSKWMRQANSLIQIWQQNVMDYVHVEASCAPTRMQVEHFYQEIAVLRDDVERAAQRIERLLQKKKSKIPPFMPPTTTI